MIRHRRSSWLLAPICWLSLTLALISPGASAASTAAPGWEITAHTAPTYLPPQGLGTIVINVFNDGAAGSQGAITVTDVLPAGVTAEAAGAIILPASSAGPALVSEEKWACSGNGPGNGVSGATLVRCENARDEFPGGGGAPGRAAFEQPQIGIVVKAGGEASDLPNHVMIAGGGAPTTATASDPITISPAAPPFQFVTWDGWFSNADGTMDTQAGSHPYEATFTFELADQSTETEEGGSKSILPSGGDPKDIVTELPPGLIVNPTAVGECRRELLAAEACPASTQIGTVTTYFGEAIELSFRLYNLVPSDGAPAQVGFNFGGVRTVLSGSIRSGGDYGINADVERVAKRHVVGVVLTLWGVPTDPSHNRWRSTSGPALAGCTEEQLKLHENGCEEALSQARVPLLTLPTNCGPLAPTVIKADTWQSSEVKATAAFSLHDPNGNLTSITGCEHLDFGSAFEVTPSTARSDAASGLLANLEPSLGGLEAPTLLAASNIQDATVTLPEGLVVNPGQAAGLQACAPNDDGLTTVAEKERGEENDAAARCPEASKIGTVKITSPLLNGAEEKQLEGNVYVLQSDPPEVRILVAASGDGINVKLPGLVRLDEATGRVTATFENTPDLPFSDFKLSFEGGARAALNTPTQCGSYATNAMFVPWGSPFVAGFHAQPSFALTEGANGNPCPNGPLPFAPAMVAGSTSNQAGQFTSFSMALVRADGEQRVERLQFTAPAGVAGIIPNVQLCDETDANGGTCPVGSQIGHATVSAGAGNDPLVLPQPGAPQIPVYLTGPYKGAPFGLSIATPVIAGPFNLGTIVTRARLDVDPVTARVTVTTDPLPQIVKGVPTDIRAINVLVDHSKFLFNPTHCAPLASSGVATSAQNVSAALSSPFDVVGCKNLQFTPTVKASIGGHPSRRDGASFSLKFSYPKDGLGSQSWLSQVKLTIPKQIPSRLTTLQRACRSTIFESNPAGCPTGSVIGHAVVHTPILPVPLSGPVYFVSYGSAKFPDVVIVLQGDNVNLMVRADTLIRGGVTSATVRAVPDAPFESVEITLPAGPFSEFGANLPAKAKGSFCKQHLTMPIILSAQDGLTLHRNTPIGVTGCHKVKHGAHKHSHKRMLKRKGRQR
jgi:hypothetical protein